MDEAKPIVAGLFDTVAAQAAATPRRRMNYNFHQSAADNPHRFLNVLLSGTYIRPHRHLTPPKAETFLVLEGEVDAILFDDAGSICARHALGVETENGRVWGIDVAPGMWHTVLPRSARAVCFEVKPGPWVPASDKEFAPWAPTEDSPEAAEYCRRLLEGD
ncbi:MAG TPA: WbuC family cupin fold metalloprotein [Bryobacteraceae bacterium]|jgi:cupin fold WbuC family metalloprotein|nr:WbuC family cupin fold metalloprotein [Bryobacteraceae bacterium]